MSKEVAIALVNIAKLVRDAMLDGTDPDKKAAMRKACLMWDSDWNRADGDVWVWVWLQLKDMSEKNDP